MVSNILTAWDTLSSIQQSFTDVTLVYSFFVSAYTLVAEFGSLCQLLADTVLCARGEEMLPCKDGFLLVDTVLYAHIMYMCFVFMCVSFEIN